MISQPLRSNDTPWRSDKKTAKLLTRSVLTKLSDDLDHELKVNASAVETGNAHLSGTFRGDAGKPAVAQLTHTGTEEGADFKCA